MVCVDGVDGAVRNGASWSQGAPAGDEAPQMETSGASCLSCGTQIEIFDQRIFTERVRRLHFKVERVRRPDSRSGLGLVWSRVGIES